MCYMISNSNGIVIIMYETNIKETPLGLTIEIPVTTGKYEDEIDTYDYIGVSIIFL